MQPRLAAVRCAPISGFGPDQPHAGAGAVEMHLVLRGEQRCDVIVAKEIRRAMRAVDHADLPVAGQYRSLRGCQRARSFEPAVCSAICSTSPAFSAPVAWPPNMPSVNTARDPKISGASNPPRTAR